jgi:membrane-associated phospholipid phosphatase
VKLAELVLGLMVIGCGVLGLLGAMLRGRRDGALSLTSIGLFLLSSAGLLGFGGIYYLFHTQGSPLAVDASVHDLLGGHLEDALYKPLKLITWFGDWKILIPVFVVIGVPLFKRKEPWAVWLYAGAVVGTGLCVGTLKAPLGRVRPADLLVAQKDGSFPSGHAAVSFAFYLSVVALAARRQPGKRLVGSLLALVMVALVGYTRLFLRVHWLTDVLGGYLLATFWFFMASLVDNLSQGTGYFAQLRTSMESPPPAISA